MSDDDHVISKGRFKGKKIVFTQEPVKKQIEDKHSDRVTAVRCPAHLAMG